MSIYNLTVDKPLSLSVDDIINCPYSGSAKSIKLPKGKYKLEVWGAMGGYRSSISYAGKGGYAVGILSLNVETELFLYAGGSGNTGGINGGFNGGGRRSLYNGGGGASDIRVGQDSLLARVIVAGGGGSDGAINKNGYHGGGTSGGSSTQSYGTGGYGGTQTGNTWKTTTQSTNISSSSDAYAGFGFGGNGITYSNGHGGAGGSGWYGGSGSYPDGSGDDDRGGGGGSGYIYTSDSASNYPIGCLLNSSHYLSEASMIAGSDSIILPDGTTSTGVSSDGYVRITVIEIESKPSIYININGVWKPIKGMYKNVNGIWR